MLLYPPDIDDIVCNILCHHNSCIASLGNILPHTTLYDWDRTWVNIEACIPPHPKIGKWRLLRIRHSHKVVFAKLNITESFQFKSWHSSVMYNLPDFPLKLTFFRIPSPQSKKPYCVVVSLSGSTRLVRAILCIWECWGFYKWGIGPNWSFQSAASEG